MKYLHDLKEMICEELEEYARKGELSAGSLDVIHKLTDTVKNIDKILKLEEYGEEDESYETAAMPAEEVRTTCVVITVMTEAVMTAAATGAGAESVDDTPATTVKST